MTYTYSRSAISSNASPLIVNLRETGASEAIVNGGEVVDLRAVGAALKRAEHVSSQGDHVEREPDAT